MYVIGADRIYFYLDNMTIFSMPVTYNNLRLAFPNNNYTV